MSNNMTIDPMPIDGVGIRMSACGHTNVPAARIAAPATGDFMGATYVATTAVKPMGHVSLLADGDVRVQVRTRVEAAGSDVWRPPST